MRGNDRVVGRIILKWIFQKYNMKMRTGLNCRRIGIVAHFCEHCNEPSGSIKVGHLRAE
jgi:hypothetical protein